MKIKKITLILQFQGSSNGCYHAFSYRKFIKKLIRSKIVNFTTPNQKHNIHSAKSKTVFTQDMLEK